MGGCWVAVGSSWPLTPFLNGSCMPVTATHPLILCYYFTTMPYFANILPHHNGYILSWPLPSTGGNIPVTELLTSTHHATILLHTTTYLSTTPHTIALHATSSPACSATGWQLKSKLRYTVLCFSTVPATRATPSSYCTVPRLPCKAATELRVSPKQTDAPIPINLQPSSYLLHLHAQSTILFNTLDDKLLKTTS